MNVLLLERLRRVAQRRWARPPGAPIEDLLVRVTDARAQRIDDHQREIADSDCCYADQKTG